MSARLTVVLDDAELYRRLKLRALEDGVPMKDIIVQGLRQILGEPAVLAEPGSFDWLRYEALMSELRSEDEARGDAGEEIPANLSDIKHHLYGYPPAQERVLRLAEEPSPYSST